MTRPIARLFVALACAAAASVSASAQVVPAPAPPPSQERSATSIEVEIVISRFQGEKRISSVPYVLAVTTGQSLDRAPETQLNMGTEVPVPVSVVTPAPASGATPPAPQRSFNYRPVGTSINAIAAAASEGRFEVRLFIDDTSIYTAPDTQQSGMIADMPVFRNFRSRNTLLLRDGQSRQYTAATDRVSGEVVKVDVTLRVVK